MNREQILLDCCRRCVNPFILGCCEKRTAQEMDEVVTAVNRFVAEHPEEFEEIDKRIRRQEV